MLTRALANIGFIGLGNQGAPMARAIAAAGFKLHAWAKRPASLQNLAPVSFKRHDDVQELGANADAVLLCLTDDRDIWDILETHGLVKTLKAGAVVVNHGTGDPGENTRISGYLVERGYLFLDAPVSGGGPAAVARSLTTIVGGDRSGFDLCRPIFDTFSRKTVYVGPSGAGQFAKLLNNALTMSNLQNATEVFLLGKQLGLDIGALYEVVSNSSGSSAVLESIGREITASIAPHLQQLMRKDIEHFADAIRSRGLDATGLRQRGISGANGLVSLVESITISGEAGR